MNLFDEQLKLRREVDEENFSESMETLADAILGDRVKVGLSKEETANSAIEKILKFFNFKLPKDDIPAEIETVEDRIEYQMRPFGVSYRNVVLDKGWYRHAIGPMIGTLKEDGTVVALIPSKFSGYCYVDLQTGIKKHLNYRTAKLLDEEAICFYRPLPPKELSIKDVFSYMIKQINVSDIVIHFALLAASALVGMLSPVFNRLLFGVVLQSKNITVLGALANFILCYSLCMFCITSFKSIVEARITTKINVSMEAATMNRILYLPVKFFRNYSSGELLQRSSYMQTLCSKIISTIASAGVASVFSLVYFYQIFKFAPSLVVPAILVILATVIVDVVTILRQIKISRQIMEHSAKTSGLTYSTISGIQKIKLAGAEKRVFSRWAKHFAKESSLEYNPPLLLKISSTITLAVSLIGTILIYYLAASSKVLVSDYYAFNSAYGMIVAAFGSVTAIVSNIASIKPMLEMVEPIMKEVPEFSEGKKEINSLDGAIELSHVSFSYDENGKDVIHDLSLKIQPSEYVAIVGKTGCGKSTLLRLLLGFEVPKSGSIFYDNHNLSKLDLKSVRKLIGTVMQDGKLFTGDLYSNIIISAPELSLDDAWEAARLACLDEDIDEMPMGMHTLICEGQGGISGGQKQRLMIARALAPKPKILMFDEATSALDNITQSKVTKAIDSLDCTRIVIAHRLSTIRNADRIICMDNGSIIEEGTYEQLIENNGLFAELVERQRLDIDED